MHLDAQSTCDLGRVSYEEGLKLQLDYARRREADEIGDTLLLCEHPAVYTLGTNSDARFILDAKAPVIQTDRGGEVTWHGPGQVVGYAICNLDTRNRDLHKHCRDLEEVLIRTLKDCGIAAERIEGLTGVWTNGKKIGALGVRVRRWISTHGFSLNVNCDLSYYEGIVPCGIEGCEVTTIERETSATPDVRPLLAKHFAEVFGA
jgi:lipoyl(octanoyl) transferase